MKKKSLDEYTPARLLLSESALLTLLSIQDANLFSEGVVKRIIILVFQNVTFCNDLTSPRPGADRYSLRQSLKHVKSVNLKQAELL